MTEKMTTKNDIMRLFGIIQSEYPNFTTQITFEQVKVKQNLWYDALKNYPLKAVESVLYDHLKSSPYEPKISDLVKRLEELAEASKPTAIDYWNELCEALGSEELRQCYFAVKLPTVYYDEALQDLYKIFYGLSPVIRRYVGSPNNLLDYFELNNEQKGYEKLRFLKAAPDLQKSEEQKVKAEEFFKLMGDRKALKDGEDD